MGTSISQGHDNKISWPYASFMINRTQMKFKNLRFVRFQISALGQESKTYLPTYGNVSNSQNGLDTTTKRWSKDTRITI